MMCIMFSENFTCQAVPFALKMLACRDVYHCHTCHTCQVSIFSYFQFHFLIVFSLLFLMISCFLFPVSLCTTMTLTMTLHQCEV